MLINRISKRSRINADCHQFQIHTIETFLLETPNSTPHSMFEEYYSMIWIEKGKGEITIDPKRFRIEENTIYYIKPGQALKLEITNYSKGFIICFDREFFELYEKKRQN